MTPQNSLDHKGNLNAYPFAELLAEIEQANLDGSMRLSRGDSKAIVYFRDGAVVYAVSNAREHRLLNLLLEAKKVEQARLAKLPKCTNDVELAATLVKEGVLPKNEVDAVVINQIERILINALSWTEGEWHYSPLVKSREDLVFNINTHKILTDYARCLPPTAVLVRFRSMRETFEKRAETNGGSRFQEHEKFVLSSFNGGARKIEELAVECGSPESGLLQMLYVLWLGGMLYRRDWNAAFSENRIAAIRNARIALVKQAQKTAPEKIGDAPKIETPTEAAETQPAEEQKSAEVPVIEISLDDYLKRVEEGQTHYDMLGVEPKAEIREIKASYFSLAKMFHPDRYHRETPEKLQRIHAAFSNVQVAYDTLKSSDSRENYDFKIRKEIEMKEKLKAQGVKVEDKIDSKTEQGLENFEAGLSLLMDEEYERAIPFLGRAAHYNPENALYRAYYGKALSYDDKQRHKAEGEMQAAARLDPKNAKIRLMLVEFFMENNLLKRAEGELKRFLEVDPNNSEARQLLANLRQ